MLLADESGQAVAEYVAVVALVCVVMAVAGQELLDIIRDYFWMLLDKMATYTYP